ncbi:hypothetical protein, partial [Rhodococcus opacus]
MDAITQVPVPTNEPVHTYAPGSPERSRVQSALTDIATNPVDIP